MTNVSTEKSRLIDENNGNGSSEETNDGDEGDDFFGLCVHIIVVLIAIDLGFDCERARGGNSVSICKFAFIVLGSSFNPSSVIDHEASLCESAIAAGYGKLDLVTDIKILGDFTCSGSHPCSAIKSIERNVDTDREWGLSGGKSWGCS